jgi:hypothetical protein
MPSGWNKTSPMLAASLSSSHPIRWVSPLTPSLYLSLLPNLHPPSPLSLLSLSHHASLPLPSSPRAVLQALDGIARSMFQSTSLQDIFGVRKVPVEGLVSGRPGVWYTRPEKLPLTLCSHTRRLAPVESLLLSAPSSQPSFPTPKCLVLRSSVQTWTMDRRSPPSGESSAWPSPAMEGELRASQAGESFGRRHMPAPLTTCTICTSHHHTPF